jgi:serine/threonine protein kinase
MFVDPYVGDTIALDGQLYTFTEAPNAPGILYAEIGRKAKVYRLQKAGSVFALKAFKPRYRSAANVDNTDRIAKYRDVPGLAVANRMVVSPDRYPDIVQQNSAFAYSILMPWVEGKSWFNYITGKLPIGRQESMQLALSLLGTMIELEQRNLAHCDLSSSNFIFSFDYHHVELIDIEDMFGFGLKEPDDKPNGTGGYAPNWVKSQGVWESAADRFSTGILISEILGWQFEKIREASDGDSYFADGEFGNKSKRFRLLSEHLEQIHPELPNLFKTVWYAESFEECPRITDWKHLLESIKEPQLEVTPVFLNFGVLDVRNKRQAQPSITVKIKNAGGGTLRGQVISNLAWLRVTPDNFANSEGSSSEHTVTLNSNFPIARKQREYVFKNGLTITNGGTHTSLPASYALSFPESPAFNWNYLLLLLTVVSALVVCGGLLIGWSVLNSRTAPPIASTTEQIALLGPENFTTTHDNAVTPSLQYTATPAVAKWYVYVNKEPTFLYTGPNKGFPLVSWDTYSKGDRFTVLTIDRTGEWLFCTGPDNVQGWIPMDSVDIEFSPSIIPTASYIPPVPTLAPTRKPHRSH